MGCSEDGRDNRGSECAGEDYSSFRPIIKSIGHRGQIASVTYTPNRVYPETIFSLSSFG